MELHSSTPSVLKQIVAHKKDEITAWQQQTPLSQLIDQAQAQAAALPLAAQLQSARPRLNNQPATTPPNIIAEIKLRSPSKGAFPWHGDVSRQVAAYQQGGARAISVVTDQHFFGGSNALFQQVRQASQLPLLQKDFVLTDYQLYLSRSIGADACLLIAAILSSAQLQQLAGKAKEIGLHTLIEVTNAAEFEMASAAGGELIGVNNRNLHTFEVNTQRTLDLLPLYAPHQVCIAESGFGHPSQLAELMQAGVDGFLIGETLMRATDAAQTLTNLRQQALSKAS